MLQFISLLLAGLDPAIFASPDTSESGARRPTLFLESQYVFFPWGRTVDQKNSCKSVSRSKSAEEAAAKLLKSPKHRCGVVSLVQHSEHSKMDTIQYRLN